MKSNLSEPFKLFLLYKHYSNIMRKLEKQMNQAIRGQRNWAGSNTTVFTTDNGLESTVYLHGNHIATYFHDTRELQIFDGGWQSVTTKSRLNALLDEFDYGSFVFQKNWQWFFARNFNPSHKVDFISGMFVR